MITQYTNSSGYSSVDSATQAVVANKISLLDKYVLMQTGEYEWTALVKNTMSKKTTQYIITRNSSGYSVLCSLFRHSIFDKSRPFILPRLHKDILV